MLLTISQIAAKLGVERDVAYNLAKFLEGVGLMRKTGDREKPPSGRGLGAEVYELDLSVATGRVAILAKIGG